MRVLIVGAGGVGASIASIAARRQVFEQIVLADVDHARAARAAARAGAPHVLSTRVDASDMLDLVELIRSVRADVVVNACDPRFNPPIFDAAFTAGCHYLDMAMHMSTPHPTDPYNTPGVMLGDAQFAVADQWEARGLLALVGMGVEPGFSDVAARYAADHLFSRIDEIGVRDGADLVIDGFAFAPTFSIWTTIEECLNPPIVYERDRGWFTTEPFSEPEVFDFPDGIGPLACVNVEHEEVLLMPRWIDVGRVTFKYGLGDEFIDVLKTLRKLGLDSTRPVKVRGVDVSPRDVVAAILPNPAELGDRMTGRTCAGSLVTGLGVDGQPRCTYLYQVVDNEWTMREYGHQAVVWQTAVHPVVALEMLATGEWKSEGVKGPEAFCADPFLALLTEHGAPWAMEERLSR
ncbi:MAG TPA: saccharopine dehydrogenase NADP-binding domain-containing protein [Ilumatobacteraceae bacterium]|nr:saccharopine dehydrogenase NADP-binding domain-containing protein [Ilumatobacteraceae bacterium]